MAAAGAAMGLGKKAALAAVGLFSGVGGAVAYKLDQVIPRVGTTKKKNLMLMYRRCKLSCPSTLPTFPGPTAATLTPWTMPASGVATRYLFHTWPQLEYIRPYNYEALLT